MSCVYRRFRVFEFANPRKLKYNSLDDWFEINCSLLMAACTVITTIIVKLRVWSVTTSLIYLPIVMRLHFACGTRWAVQEFNGWNGKDVSSNWDLLFSSIFGRELGQFILYLICEVKQLKKKNINPRITKFLNWFTEYPRELWCTIA